MQKAVKQGAKGSVTDYLAALTWDGTPRIDRWLVDCAGAEYDPRTRSIRIEANKTAQPGATTDD